MASRAPLVIANGRFQQQQAADTLAVPGAVSTPSYYEVGEIATPATPAAGFGRIYAKSDNKLYFLNDLGTEVDLSATATPAGSTGAVQFNNAGAFGADSANFFWDDTNNRLGIGNAAPGNTLHVTGDARITTNLLVDGNSTLGDAAGDTLTINGTAVSIPNNLNFDSNTLFIDATNNRVGIGTNAPTQPLHVVGNSRLAGDVVVTGNLTVQGTTTTVDSETVLIADNHLYLNNGYTTAVAQTGGLVVNYLPTATTTTVNAAYVAGVAATSNPTVGTTAAAAFAVGQLIQISGSTVGNDGLYEVLSNAANVLTIRGVGVTGCVEDFTQNQFTAGASDGATITRVNVSIMRSGTDGLWEVGAGSSTPITFTDLGTGSGTVTGTGSSGAVAFWNGTSSITEDPTQLFWDNTNNRLGIGTATPGNTLHVAGSARVTTTLQVDGNTTLGDAAGDTLTVNGTAVSIPNNLNIDSNTFFINSSTDRVGIGTATPTSKLEVVDTTDGYAGVYFQNASTGASGRAQLSAYNSANGFNAGILSTGFVGALGGTTIVANEAFVLANGNPAGLAIESATNGSYIKFGIFAVEKARIAATEFVVNDAGNAYNFRVESDTDANNLFSDGTNNRVGIGTATPAQKLDVSGNVRSTGFYEVAEIATPATPASGFGRIYAKADNLLYFLNDAGAEYDLTGATGTVITGQTTTGLADGDFGYVSAANTWTKAQNDGTATQATVISCNEGVASQMALPGSVIESAKFTTAGGSPAVGASVWLAAAAEDAGTGAGKLTATAPTASGAYLVLVGVCVDAANYAGSKTAKVIFSPAAPVLI